MFTVVSKLRARSNTSRDTTQQYLVLAIDGESINPVLDTSPYAHTITDNGTVSRDTSDKVTGTGSLSFVDGTDAGLSFTGGSELILNGAFTITFDFKLPANAGPVADYIIGSNNPAGVKFYLMVGANSKTLYVVLNGGGGSNITYILPSLNTWYAIKITRSSSTGNILLYVDNVLRGTHIGTGVIVGSVNYINDTYGNTANTGNLKLDNLKIYNGIVL